MVRISLIAGALAGSLALAVYGCFAMETLDHSFASWPDAVASGQTGPGKWIPADIPPKAVDIRTTYAIDSSHVLVAFRLPPGAEHHLPDRCTPVAPAAVQLTQRPARWWPDELSGKSNPTAETSFYACGDNEYYALAGARGYFWRL